MRVDLPDGGEKAGAAQPRRVEVIGHRGAKGHAPENTMAAFELARQMGADRIELDVHRTRDGRLVVIHDVTVERTTSGRGAVPDLTWDEIGSLDAGRWFGEAFAGERVPLLQEVLSWARLHAMPLNVEIKTAPALYAYPGIAADLARLLKETGYPAEALIVSSFDHRVVVESMRHLPAAAGAALFEHYPASLADLPGKCLHPRGDYADADLVAGAHRLGRRVNVWTLNAREHYERAVQLGVDGIITDYPDRLRQFLAARDASHTRTGSKPG